MKTNPVHAWDYALERSLKDMLNRRKESLLGGSPPDYPAYREQVGEIRGIQFAIDELIQVREKHTDEDEE